LSLLFAMSAFMKMRHGPDVMQGMAHLGLPKSLITLLASVEISCAVIYAIPATAVLGAILLTGYIGGAILAHMRVGDPFFVQIRVRTVRLARPVPPRESSESASSSEKETHRDTQPLRKLSWGIQLCTGN